MNPYTKPNESFVLSNAVITAAAKFNISHSVLSKILGLSPSNITRLCNGQRQLDQSREEWELALLFVRIFHSLDSLIGNEQSIRLWLNSENQALCERPLNLIVHADGLIRVVNYLDSRLHSD